MKRSYRKRVATLREFGQAIRMALALRIGGGRLRRVLSIEQAFAGQLPALLETISGLNNRQILIDSSHENLTKSMPIALRKLRRDLNALMQEAAEQRKFLTEMREEQGKSLVKMREEYRRILDDHAGSITYLLGRVEFVRRETLFEMRFGGSRDPRLDSVEPKVLSPDKLAAARRSGLRLNLGCGHLPLEDYLNIDQRELPRVDIVAEITALPFQPGEVAEIFSAHVLEHFPQEQLRREVLPYLKSLLRPGGLFRAVVPDAQAMIREHAGGRYPFELLREVVFGGQDYEGDFHYNMFTPEHLTGLLHEAGFEGVQVPVSGRRNGNCYEFEIRAELMPQ